MTIYSGFREGRALLPSQQCSELPGHSGCMKDINRRKCPVFTNEQSGCPRSQNLPNADKAQAGAWLKLVRSGGTATKPKTDESSAVPTAQAT